jgi:hypothetical protein
VALLYLPDPDWRGSRDVLQEREGSYRNGRHAGTCACCSASRRVHQPARPPACLPVVTPAPAEPVCRRGVVCRCGCWTSRWSVRACGSTMPHSAPTSWSPSCAATVCLHYIISSICVCVCACACARVRVCVSRYRRHRMRPADVSRAALSRGTHPHGHTNHHPIASRRCCSWCLAGVRRENARMNTGSDRFAFRPMQVR